MGIAPTIGGRAGFSPREEILQAGFGYQSWSFDPNRTSGGTAPTAGTVYLRAIPYRLGQVIAKTCFLPGTAGAGTKPTSIFTGICDSTGKMLAQSANDNNNAAWTTNVNEVQSPLSASLTITADGLYYHVFLQVGAWGTTQLALAKDVSATAAASLGGSVVFGTGVTTSQTTLPANGSSIAGGIVVTNGINFWTGAS